MHWTEREQLDEDLADLVIVLVHACWLGCCGACSQSRRQVPASRDRCPVLRRVQSHHPGCCPTSAPLSHEQRSLSVVLWTHGDCRPLFDGDSARCLSSLIAPRHPMCRLYSRGPCRDACPLELRAVPHEGEASRAQWRPYADAPSAATGSQEHRHAVSISVPCNWIRFCVARRAAPEDDPILAGTPARGVPGELRPRALKGWLPITTPGEYRP